MTPRLLAVIIGAAIAIWIGNALLPLVSTYQSESGIGVAVLGLFGVALGVGEWKRRNGDEGDGDDESGGDAEEHPRRRKGRR